jgi:hypothetical protein
MFSPHLLLAVRQGARTGTRLAAACAIDGDMIVAGASGDGVDQKATDQ